MSSSKTAFHYKSVKEIKTKLTLTLKKLKKSANTKLKQIIEDSNNRYIRNFITPAIQS